jgi:hypothetical protein
MTFTLTTADGVTFTVEDGQLTIEQPGRPDYTVSMVAIEEFARLFFDL